MHHQILSAIIALAFSLGSSALPPNADIINNENAVIVKTDADYTVTDLSAFGFYSLDDVMMASGFTKLSDFVYSKKTALGGVIVSFDIKNNVCNKNLYEFDISDDVKVVGDTCYITDKLIKNVLSGTAEYQGKTLKFTPFELKGKDWLKYPNLIAHAGGGLRTKEEVTKYTNSLEALVQNYNLGHRVFEFDLYLTADDKLAVAHDWEKYGYFLTERQWKSANKPYTTMMIGDVLDQMMVNEDMFIVTDTKSTEFTKEQARLQFEIIRDEAIKRDSKLLDRIIPQVYDESHYKTVMSVYPFESVIYTIYSNVYPADRIINFALDRQNIHVITAAYNDWRLTNQTIRKIHKNKLLVYTHTINTYEEMTEHSTKGIDGFYTDVLTPDDILELVK